MWELFVSSQNRRMPHLTVGHGLKDCLPLEIPEEGKFIVSGASVACIVSHHYPWFCHHAGILRRLLVLPDTSTYSTFSWICKVSLVLSPLKTCNNSVFQCFGVFWNIKDIVFKTDILATCELSEGRLVYRPDPFHFNGTTDRISDMGTGSDWVCGTERVVFARLS